MNKIMGIKMHPQMRFQSTENIYKYLGDYHAYHTTAVFFVKRGVPKKLSETL